MRLYLTHVLLSALFAATILGCSKTFEAMASTQSAVLAVVK